MNKLAKYLNQHIVGNVYDREAILEAYSTDRSVLKILPKFVAIPESTEDIQKLVQFSNELAKKKVDLPITVRGSGLDKTGADLGDGLVISTEKLNRVQEIDDRSRLVRVQAGVTLEKLNAVLAVYGLTLPVKADPRETIGGLIAGYPADGLAKKYGGIFYFTERLEAVLSDGEILQTLSYTKRGMERYAKQRTDFVGSIYRHVDDIIQSDFDVINDMNKPPRDYSGYRMVAQVANERSFDLMPLFFASQGTLGIITEVILRVEPILRPATRMLVTFRSMKSADEFMRRVAELAPSELTLYDARILMAGAANGKEIDCLPKTGNNYTVVVGFDDSHFAQAKKVRRLLKMTDGVEDSDVPDVKNSAPIVVETESNAEDFAKIDNCVQSYLNDGLTGERTALMDDFYLPPEQLQDFVRGLAQLEETFGVKLPLYGNYATSVYSVRPELELTGVVGRQKAVSLLRAFCTFVRDHKGSITGASAEGRTKAIFTTPEQDKRVAEVYEKVKAAFDPMGILNPEVKLGAEQKNTVRHLRASENHQITS